MLSTRIRLHVVPMLVLAMSLHCPRGVFAAIRTVTDFGDTTPGGAPGQLRFEINAAAPGDTIVIPAGTIALTGAAGEDANVSGDLDITKNLTIQGAGQGVTIIDGGGIDRVFEIFASTVTISGMTIRNGNVGAVSIEGAGGGIYNEGTLTLANVTVSGNTSGFRGGGIYNQVGTVTLTNVTVSGNTASEFGGGIANNNSPDATLTLVNATVSGNTADTGGGISAGGTVTLSDVNVSGNIAQRAGGIQNFGPFGTMTLTNATVSGNTASESGSGIHNNGGTLTLTNATVSGNTAGEAGGGIRNSGSNSPSSMTLTNVTVSGNSASTGGGISSDPNTSSQLTNVTISGNTASVSGGGMSGPATLRNTIVANSPSGGNCFGTMTSLGHNLDSGTTCAFAGPGDLTNTDAIVGPLGLLGPLQNNGGPTATHALLPGSPAIDAGDNTGCPPIDQRGFVRTVDGDTNGSATCDIGAFELGPAIAAALAASILPSGRSVQVGTAATAFATILNAGPGTALGCRIAPVPSLPAAFAYQTTDSLTNTLIGSPNTPVDIPAGGGQSFVLAVTPTAPIPPTDVLLSFACTNTAPAPPLVGVSTLFLVAAATPVPDPVALAATTSNDGTLTLASAGAFAMATVNVGASALLTVTPDTGGASLPLTLSICQTDAGANCLATPAASVTTQIDAGATPTFSIFADATGPIPFLPGTNRIFVRFTDGGGVTRGATSVAVRTL